jgi:hypothetical protein
MDKLFAKSERIIQATSLTLERYLSDEVDWNERLIGLRGARGTGKSTIMLQYLKKQGQKNSLYVTLDDMHFTKHSLSDLADEFYTLGGRKLFLDEVHKYPTWSTEIKNLYDFYPQLQIVFSSSSVLQIDKGEADLSRRAVKYTLHELSFREYLALVHKQNFDVLSLSDILNHHVEIAHDVAAKIVPVKLFHDYLIWGAYPFISEGRKNFQGKLNWAVSQAIENDIPAVEEIRYETVIKLKKLLMLLSASVPYKPNITELSAKVGTSRDNLLRFLQMLANARLIQLLRQDGSPTSYLTKPEKIYLNNTSLMHCLNDNPPSAGALRETFFMNQLLQSHTINYSGAGDFLVDRKYTFEVGGQGKTAFQIKAVRNSYVVKDMLETGAGNHIPLWLFGMMY